MYRIGNMAALAAGMAAAPALIDGDVCFNLGWYDFDTQGDVLGVDAFGRAVPGRAPVMPALKQAPAKFAGRPGPSTPVVFPPQPVWRPQLAPGVPIPGLGQQPLPLTPSANNGVFALAFQSLTFSARPQAPFRAERLMVTVRRTGAAGVILQANSLFIGRNNQLVQTGPFDIEFFAPTAFDTRLALDAAEPGIDISITVTANPAIAGADTIAVSMMLLGQAIRS